MSSHRAPKQNRASQRPIVVDTQRRVIRRLRRDHRNRASRPGGAPVFRSITLMIAPVLFFGLFASPALSESPQHAHGTSFHGTSIEGGVDLVAVGERALRAGHYDRAISLLVHATYSGLSEQDRSAALANLCAAYLGTGAAGSALRSCASAEDLGGPTWQIHNNRGIAYLMLDEHERARDEFQKALDLKPSSRYAQRGLAKARERAAIQAIASTVR